MDVLESQALLARQTGWFLHSLVAASDRLENVTEISAIRQKCRDLSGAARRAVDGSFDAPLPHPELHELRFALYDLTSSMVGVIDRLELFRLPVTNADLIAVVEVLDLEAEAIGGILACLHRWTGRDIFRESRRDLDRLTAQGVLALHTALARLFSDPRPDPLTALKWEEVFVQAEQGLAASRRFLNVADRLVALYS